MVSSLLLLFLEAAGLAVECGLVEPAGPGMADWTNRLLKAYGTGSPPPDMGNTPEGRQRAEILARRSAYEHLLETARSLKICRGKSVVDELSGNDTVMAEIESMLKKATTTKTRKLAEGSFWIELSTPFHGRFTDLVIPDSVLSFDVKIISHNETNAGKPEYTGLVVDARGLVVQPALCIRIIDEAGREVYGSAYASREFVVSEGMVLFETDASCKKVRKRVGETPITVNALKALPDDPSSIVISSLDASRIREHVYFLKLLHDCKVAVILSGKQDGGT